MCMQTLAPIKEYAKNHAVPIMKDEGIEYICNYIKMHNIKKILEIGSAIGYSAIRFAQISDDIFVTTVEIDKERYERAVQNIKEFGLEKRISIFLEDALNFETSEMFDLIFIDAAKAQYIKFFEKYKRSLAPNGVIVSDNLSFHGMVDDPKLKCNRNTVMLVKKIRKYVTFLRENKEFETQFIDCGDRISISHKKLQDVPFLNENC